MALNERLIGTDTYHKKARTAWVETPRADTSLDLFIKHRHWRVLDVPAGIDPLRVKNLVDAMLLEFVQQVLLATCFS
jgi:hypothetical protein